MWVSWFADEPRGPALTYPTDSSNSNGCRFFLSALWGCLCAGIVAAPLLAAHSHPGAAGVLYLFFSPVCHQIPERSFSLAGHAFAVCHRCFGIYLGLFLGSLPAPAAYCNILSPRWRRTWVLAATAPLLFDALLPFFGLGANTLWSRLASGLVFGIMVSSLLVCGIVELWHEAPWSKTRCCDSHVNGGRS